MICQHKTLTQQSGYWYFIITVIYLGQYLASRHDQRQGGDLEDSLGEFYLVAFLFYIYFF